MFWLDPWLFDVPLKDKFPSLFHLEVVKTCSVRDWLEGEGLWLWRHDPDSEVERIEWQSLTSVLNLVRLSSNPDCWSWAGLGTEGFSVAVVKKLIDSKRDYSSRIVVDWCKWVPLKCNILVWRAVMDRIPTVDALAKRVVIVADEECRFCNAGSDTVTHFFTACPLALGLWEKNSFWCRVLNFFVFFRDLLEIHNSGIRGTTERNALHGIVFTACWVLWKARNILRFNGKKRSVDEIFSEVKVVSFFWFKHRAMNGKFVGRDWCKFVNM
ncbi:uncharacterized protein LOC143573986 [Bidens hawaiensis]|uniref:uncharacterized protein LOC143573986 n=1 Tax=Bidens hawaiensis TaxID=980011 RepID=UPI004049DF64